MKGQMIRMSALALIMVMMATSCHFGSREGSGSYLLPDRDMSIRAASLPDAYYTALQWSVLDYAFNTVLSPRLSRGSCNAPGSGPVDPTETDRICVFADNYGDTGVVGSYGCRRFAQYGPVTNYHPHAACAHAHVYFNLYYSDMNRIQVACHELGHGVGLNHRAEISSCMGGPVSTTLDAHDREEINAYY